MFILTPVLFSILIRIFLLIFIWSTLTDDFDTNTLSYINHVIHYFFIAIETSFIRKWIGSTMRNNIRVTSQVLLGRFREKINSQYFFFRSCNFIGSVVNFETSK